MGERELWGGRVVGGARELLNYGAEGGRVGLDEGGVGRGWVCKVVHGGDGLRRGSHMKELEKSVIFWVFFYRVGIGKGGVLSFA